MDMKYFELKQKQSLPLHQKVILSEKAIRDFYEGVNGKVYVAFSGGKDSTVLLDIVRSIYPDTPAIFCDTGLEYPEIKAFVKSIDNVTTIKPKISFKQVLETEGYPIISKQIAYQIRNLQNPTEHNKQTCILFSTGIKKDGSKSRFSLMSKKWKYLINAPFKVSEKCCDVMKKEPMHRYQKETGRYQYLGLMASDSDLRQAQYLRNGCNTFKGTIQSQPIGFWLEKDVWSYIKTNKLPYATIYDKGIDRTGCMFCMFGVHLDPYPNRFQRMKRTHPKLWNYCINRLGLREVLNFIGVSPD
jgi:3'-phosphoadenosine 5'-phosphosulfate sulfotransferase (PAPS reductase)/FAD synthetase